MVHRKISEIRSEYAPGTYYNSAITSDELIDYIYTIIQGNYIGYYLKAGIGTVSTEILAYLAKEYNMKGFDIELYHQPLNPDRLQTLVVKGLKIAAYESMKMFSTF
ncbi:MAG: hypothetical protein ACYCX4_09085 [Bacillota bacterium]